MSASKEIVTTKSVLFIGAAILLSACFSFSAGWYVAGSTINGDGDLQKRVESNKVERQKLNAELIETRKFLVQAKNEKSLVDAENEKLQQQKINSTKEVESLKTKIVQLKSKPAIGSVNQAKELTDAKKSVDQLRVQLRESSQEFEQLKKTNGQLNQELVSVKNALEAGQVDLKKKNAELVQKNIDQAEELAGTKRSVDQLRAQIGESSQARVQLEKTNGQLNLKLVSVKNALEASQVDFKKLATKYEDQNGQISKLRDDLATLVASNGNLKQDQALLNQQLQSAKDAREVVEASLKKNNEELNTLKKGGDRLALLRTERDNYASRLEEQTKNSRAIQSENSALHNKITSSKIKINRLNDATSQYEAELKIVRMELWEKRNEISQLTSDLLDEKEKSSGHVANIATIKRELNVEKNKVRCIANDTTIDTNPTSGPLKLKSKQQIALEFVREYYQDLDSGRVDAAVAKWAPDKKKIRGDIQKVVDARVKSIAANADGSSVHVVVRVRKKNKSFETWDLDVFLNSSGKIWTMDGYKVN